MQSHHAPVWLGCQHRNSKRGSYQLGYRLKAEQQRGTPGWNDAPKLCNATLERPSSILWQETSSDAGPKWPKLKDSGA